MNDEQFLINLRAAFAIEADEHLQAMTAGLLELEKAPAASQQKELIETIFREAHSLKGAAGAVDRTDLQAICQVLESIFSEWKRKPARVSAETFDTLGRSLDVVGKLLRLPGAAAGAAEQNELSDMINQLGEVNRAPTPMVEMHQSPLPAATKVRASKAAASSRKEPAPVAPPALTESPAVEGEGPHLSETVRIPMAKMDALLRQAEEMIAVKLTASQHAMEIKGLVGSPGTELEFAL